MTSGDIVRRNGKEELGTVLSLQSKASVRVLETNNHLSSICGNRLGTFYWPIRGLGKTNPSFDSNFWEKSLHRTNIF